jgi:hypothetical protein
MDKPGPYRRYECGDYFAQGWAEKGHFDPHSQTPVVAPLSEAYENAEIGFFAVGRSGWGGIDFGYRLGERGLWAYYPITREFKFIAATVAELVDGYLAGKLHV